MLRDIWMKLGLGNYRRRRGTRLKYRKKPVVIDAFCLGVDNIPDWFVDGVTTDEIHLHGEPKNIRHADIHTLEGTMRANKGDYVIRGVKGEIYPIQPDIFAETYEPAV